MDFESLLTHQLSGVAFAALLILKLGEMSWAYFRSREKRTDTNISELKALLERNTAALTTAQTEMCKLKLDLRRCFFAIKKVSGESWAEIAEEMRQFSDSES